MENPIKMDDLGVPSFGNTNIKNISFKSTSWGVFLDVYSTLPKQTNMLRTGHVEPSRGDELGSFVPFFWSESTKAQYQLFPMTDPWEWYIYQSMDAWFLW